MENQNNIPQNQNNIPQPKNESKTVIGIVMGLFLGLIGLIIGLIIYKEGTYERKTFVKAWGWTFLAVVLVSIVSSIIYGVVIARMLTA